MLKRIFCFFGTAIMLHPNNGPCSKTVFSSIFGCFSFTIGICYIVYDYSFGLTSAR